MIKLCPIKTNNEFCTVVDFNGKLIQFPPVRTNAKSVLVSNENGVYLIVKEMPKNEPAKIEPKTEPELTKDEPVFDPQKEELIEREEFTKMKSNKKTIKKNKNTRLYSSYAEG